MSITTYYYPSKPLYLIGGWPLTFYVVWLEFYACFKSRNPCGLALKVMVPDITRAYTPTAKYYFCEIASRPDTFASLGSCERQSLNYSSPSLSSPSWHNTLVVYGRRLLPTLLWFCYSYPSSLKLLSSQSQIPTYL